MPPPNLTVQTDEDGFMNNLGSMDQNQLEELLNEINSRATYDFGIRDPTAKAPNVNAGAFQDPTKEFGSSWRDIPAIALKGASLSHQFKSIGKRSADKKKLAAFNAAKRAESARQKDLLAKRARMVENQIKTIGLRGKVNQQFKDLGLEGLFDRVAQAGLDKNVLGITQQHEDFTRQTGFGAVSQGLGGSSVDADRIADVQSSQDSAIAQAAASAQGQRRQLGTQADRQRQDLLNSISGSNPGEEARLTGELSNVQNQANIFGQQANAAQMGLGIDQQQMAGQSQALGGLLSSYAHMYNQNQG